MLTTRERNRGPVSATANTHKQIELIECRENNRAESRVLDKHLEALSGHPTTRPFLPHSTTTPFLTPQLLPSFLTHTLHNSSPPSSLTPQLLPSSLTPQLLPSSLTPQLVPSSSHTPQLVPFSLHSASCCWYVPSLFYL
ncbi:hypothetical protein Pmani_031968 [Petrolisthes manimaculis]|uniref:Uncharacterized protein n=1 Tax=Petrolisthes manimaculis TaxID=1843537 RepID=A0AAE1NUN0_9EUCA|nr:hypothetical protein Pmani_031968 [Petrolisthes manimaculis]